MQPYKAWMIQDVIEKNKRVFKIPVYQRNYDWNNVQCEKLYDDVLIAFDKDKKQSIVFYILEKISQGEPALSKHISENLNINQKRAVSFRRNRIKTAEVL